MSPLVVAAPIVFRRINSLALERTSALTRSRSEPDVRFSVLSGLRFWSRCKTGCSQTILQIMLFPGPPATHPALTTSRDWAAPKIEPYVFSPVNSVSLVRFWLGVRIRAAHEMVIYLCAKAMTKLLTTAPRLIEGGLCQNGTDLDERNVDDNSQHVCRFPWSISQSYGGEGGLCFEIRTQRRT